MAESYYKPCAEFYRCNELIEKYWESKQYDKCFAGHMELAEKAFYWTERAATHGDWDGQYNLGSFYEDGVGVAQDLEKAKYWYKAAAQQGHDLAIQKCREYRINYEI